MVSTGAWPSLAGTVAIAGVGAFAGRLLRIPGGALLVPLVAGAVVHWSGVVSIELPEWLLAATYALIGWKIGLGFTREVLRYASRALPKILLSIAVLLVFCGGLALVLTRVFRVDPLTAYLATSPGGIDSVAIIAASSKVDLPFVMALQTVHLFIVILIGPTFAGIVARRMIIAKPSLADQGSRTFLIRKDGLPASSFDQDPPGALPQPDGAPPHRVDPAPNCDVYHRNDESNQPPQVS